MADDGSGVPRTGRRTGRGADRAESAAPRRFGTCWFPIRPACWRIPAVRFDYFDLATQRYVDIGVPATSIAVVPGGESAATAALPPPLLTNDSPSMAWRLGHAIPNWFWLLVLLIPPLAVSLRGRIPRRARHRPPPAALAGLRGAEHELETLLDVLVPETERRTGGALAAAVRASGADPELAARVSAVRDRLLARRYGPEAKAGEDAKLTAEVQDVVQRLGGSLKAWRGGGTVRGAAVLALALLAGRPRSGHRRPLPNSCTRAARCVPRPMHSPAGRTPSRR